MTERAGQPRLQDVATLAGVSLATASRILGDPGYKGRAGARERVQDAVQELGYRPNPHARALASAMGSSVGLVVHDVRDAYFGMVSSGVIAVADRHDLVVSMVTTHRDASRELEYVRRLIAQRVRALILAGSSFRDKSHNDAMQAELEAYQDRGGSVVSVTGGRSVGHVVDVDNDGDMRGLVHALVELGHRDFGVLCGPLKLNAIRERLAGIRLGCKDAGIALDRDSIVYNDLSREGGQAGAATLLSRPHPPTCLIGVADVVAVGAMSWARENGISVPGDVSVAGYGGIAAARDTVPALTTVELPLERIGETAMEFALRPPNPRHLVEIQGELVVRESVAAIG
ncbi:MAG: LacI family DNA-binding transcriptional regulator [Beutenbergiaceae bacterium]